MTQEELNQKLLDAVKVNDINKVKEVLFLGADVNIGMFEYGWTLLLIACINNCIDIVQLLLKYGVDIEAKDKKGNSAVSYAAWYRRVDILKLLLAHGADINSVNHDGETPLIRVCGRARNNKEIITTLITGGADLDSVDHFGYTSLMYLADDGGYTGLMKLLIQSGANMNIKNRQGRTAIDMVKDKYPKKYRIWIRSVTVRQKLKKLCAEDSYSNHDMQPDWNI